MTEQLLTEKLERDIDILLQRWLGRKITHVNRHSICDLLTNFGVFQNYAEERSQLKDMQERFQKE